MPFDQEEMDYLNELTAKEIEIFQQGFTELKTAIEEIGPGGIAVPNCTPGCQGGCLQTCFNCASGGSLPQA